MKYEWMESPVGAILLARDDEGIRVIAFGEGRRTRAKPRRPAPTWERDRSSFVEEIAQLEAYFGGELKVFDLALAPQGTEFQRTVWKALLEIPYGGTISYGGLAARIRRPSASRAVGAANGANPIGIVIPCHRVIGANGSLTGYGGGIENKKKLLAHELRNEAPRSETGQIGFAFG